VVDAVGQVQSSDVRDHAVARGRQRELTVRTPVGSGLSDRGPNEIGSATAHSE
jgi:hypothetical protein